MLHEAIRAARLRAFRDRRPCVIARDGEHAYQVRITAIRKRGATPTSDVTYEVHGRRWIDQRDRIGEPKQASARGTVGPYVGWAMWSHHLGFGTDAVLATDWTIITETDS